MVARHAFIQDLRQGRYKLAVEALRLLRAARDSNPNRQIRSLVLCVDLVRSRRI